MSRFLDDKTKQSIKKVVYNYGKKRIRTLEDLGVTKDEYRNEVKKIRKKVFGDNFEKNLKEAKENLQKHGFKVSEVRDAGEARNLLKKIFQPKAGPPWAEKGTSKDTDKIVKSKSNMGKEIGVEKLLEKMGQDNFETDLGDFVVNLMEEEDQHYVLPALHLNSKQIAERIKEVYGDEVKADPKKLTRYLCKKIRANILQADTGITGANFFTQTGQVVLLENEGNISLVSRIPEKHIVICGIDKLVETIEDATQLCRVAAVFGTGQDCAQYISVVSGPSKTADIENQLVEGAQGAKEVHLILVDNGRREMVKKGFDEMVRCINCGACVNFCPVYHQMGKKYGGKFAGSKGIIMTANLSLQEDGARGSAQTERGLARKGANDASRDLDNEMLRRAKDAGSFSCTFCGVCHRNCPMGIKLPYYVRMIRAEQEKKGMQTESNKEMLKNIKKHNNPFGEKSDDEIPDKLYCC